LLQFQVESAACRDLRFSSSGSFLISGYTDGNVCFVDVQSLSPRAVCQPKASAVSAIGVALDGKLTLAGTHSADVHFVDSNYSVVFDIRDHIGTRIDAIEVSPHDSSLCAIADASEFSRSGA
jgi:WD40 repeat protein